MTSIARICTMVAILVTWATSYSVFTYTIAAAAREFLKSVKSIKTDGPAVCVFEDTVLAIWIGHAIFSLSNLYILALMYLLHHISTNSYGQTWEDIQRSILITSRAITGLCSILDMIAFAVPVDHLITISPECLTTLNRYTLSTIIYISISIYFASSLLFLSASGCSFANLICLVSIVTGLSLHIVYLSL